jgi:hypothetical protein
MRTVLQGIAMLAILTILTIVNGGAPLHAQQGSVGLKSAASTIDFDVGSAFRSPRGVLSGTSATHSGIDFINRGRSSALQNLLPLSSETAKNVLDGATRSSTEP